MQIPGGNNWYFLTYLLLMQWEVTQQQLDQLNVDLHECLSPAKYSSPAMMTVENLSNVTCNNTNLIIVRSNLKKLYNNSLRLLNNLKALGLRGNNISDIELEAFRDMTQLVTLDLGENLLSSISLSVFKPLQQLQLLYLDKNRLVDVNCVAGLTTLQFLDASSNPISENSVLIPELPRLLTLRLRNVNIKRLARNTFAKLDNICELDLTNNNMNTNDLQICLQSINTKSIRILRLGNQIEAQLDSQVLGMNKFPDISENVFPPFPNLHTLDLSQTLIQSIETPIQRVFPQLKVLTLKSNMLYEIPNKIVNSSIEYLDLSNNQISNWSRIKRLPNLKHLNLNRNRFSTFDSSDKFLAFPQLQILNLSNNNLGKIDSYSFLNLNYLKTLDLSNNTLSVIQNYTFSGLESLRNLHLEHNDLWILRNNRPFENLFNLTVLTFQHNSLCDIWPWVLPDQVNLEVLDFSYNKIERWSEQSFENTKKLRTLNLKRNDIKKFTPIMLMELSEQNFEIVDLRENEFDCDDCGMKYLIDWLDNKSKNCNKLLKSNTKESNQCLVYTEVTCLNSDKSLVRINSQNFTYLTDCNKTEKTYKMYLCVAAATLVAVIIIVVIMYKWRWHVKYYWYTLFGCQCLSRRRSLDDTYEYSAYISYCEGDRLWLQNIFLPRLENHKTNLNFYVLERDFEPGRYMIENIMEGLEKSRNFVVLLSKEYLRSGWRNWEFNWATCRLASQTTPRSPSIVILNLGEVSYKDMTPTIRSVAQTQLHYKWSHEGPRQRLIWEKLGHALAKHNTNNNNSNEEEDQNTRF